MEVSRPCLGVLGGSFDPPHLAHLVIASQACAQLGLERVLFVPAASPPHKEPWHVSSAAVRFEMAALAVRDDLRFVESSVEIERGLVYTCDTLRAVAERFPGRDLVFILGSDSLLQFETWHDPERILEVASLAVAPREGGTQEAIEEAVKLWGADRISLLAAPRMAISSTLIRERVAAGISVRYLVPEAVEEYIVEHQLYRRP